MLGLPLHPVLVHLPLVLAWLAPMVAVVILLAQHSGRWENNVWFLACGLWGALAIGSFFAVRTGETDEEVVEDVVAESVLETHEERAKTFALSTYAVFGLSVLVLLARTPKSRLVGRSAVVAAGLVCSVLSLGVGHSGGTLVYQHGAASAHVGSEMQTGGSLCVRDAHGDDDEHP